MSAPPKSTSLSRLFERRVFFYLLLAGIITLIFHGLILFRRQQLANRTRSYSLTGLKLACAAFAEDHQKFPLTWQELVDAGYLPAISPRFASSFVDNRLDPLPRSYQESDFFLSYDGTTLTIRLNRNIEVNGWSEQEMKEYFSTTLKLGELTVSKVTRQRLLEE